MSANVICVAALGDYRRGVVDKMVDAGLDNFAIYAGADPFDPTVQVLRHPTAGVRFSRNIYLFRRRFLIQWGTFNRCLQADRLIIDLNPRVLNVWAVLFIRMLLRKPTAVWGHAWPRGGAASRSDLVRGIVRRMAGNVIVYTETQARELLAKFPKLRVFAAPNALYSKREMSVSGIAADNPRNVVYVGRLVDEKKPRLLVEAFLRCAHLLPEDAELHVVGNGPLLPDLRALAASSTTAKIVFWGHVTDVQTLKAIYGNALVSVSPGYVGLSITQSFAFGVPMIISREEPHSPEIEAAENGRNSVFFETDDVGSLGQSILRFYANRDDWCGKRKDIAATCAELYSTEVMAEKLLSFFKA